MALPKGDSTAGHSFALTVDGVQITSITEVSGLVTEVDTIEMKEVGPDGKYNIRCLPGKRKGGIKIVLTRGLSQDNSFTKWIKAVRLGQMADARKNGEVALLDFEGTTIMRYKFTNGWASKVEIGSLKAGDTSVLTEKLTITAEDLEAE